MWRFVISRFHYILKLLFGIIPPENMETLPVTIQFFCINSVNIAGGLILKRS